MGLRVGGLFSFGSVQQAALQLVEDALRKFPNVPNATLSAHHQKFCDWTKGKIARALDGRLNLQTPEWNQASAEDREQCLEIVRSVNGFGDFIYHFGKAIPRILRGEIDALSVMLENDHLGRYCRDHNSNTRLYQHAAAVADVLAHQNPRLRILEICVGTGGTTGPLLQTLGSTTGPPRFSSYCFTDISTGFFDNARTKLTSWADLISFHRLDIESDPSGQGFDAGSFDVVIAANCLHATARMDNTMSNVRKPLKPGGRLILMEVTAYSLTMFPFAALPGWWLEPYRVLTHSYSIR